MKIGGPHFQRVLELSANLWCSSRWRKCTSGGGQEASCFLGLVVDLPPIETSLKLTSSPLNMDGWKMKFPVGARPISRKYVSFREGNPQAKLDDHHHNFHFMPHLIIQFI